MVATSFSLLSYKGFTMDSCKALTAAAILCWMKGVNVPDKMGASSLTKSASSKVLVTM